MSLGRPSPYAHVADNDLAVGMLVDYLSKSPIWKESVVFVVEDDAQDGPDHVDAHRSPAFVAGGYVKRNFIDHTMYSTSSILRTIELILGLPPMSRTMQRLRHFGDVLLKAPIWLDLHKKLCNTISMKKIPPIRPCKEKVSV